MLIAKPIIVHSSRRLNQRDYGGPDEFMRSRKALGLRPVGTPDGSQTRKM